jgi:hypothetical protein
VIKGRSEREYAAGSGGVLVKSIIVDDAGRKKEPSIWHTLLTILGRIRKKGHCWPCTDSILFPICACPVGILSFLYQFFTNYINIGYIAA